ncbi:hypothetical protein RZE82_06425 [Mollicutes bacterium LVI A0039]|nr:hypothetical protein RZE82_06425 [Mollicutes bacterium LVI A0039]
MSKEFKYDLEGMRAVSNNINKINSDLKQCKMDFNSAQELISGMQTLGFLDETQNKIEIISNNLFNRLAIELEDFEQMIQKNSNDVETTDINIANKFKER